MGIFYLKITNYIFYTAKIICIIKVIIYKNIAICEKICYNLYEELMISDLKEDIYVFSCSYFDFNRFGDIRYQGKT